MNKTLGVLFFLRKNRETKKGNFPIYCRLTVDGERAEFSIKRVVKELGWNAKAGYPTGTNEDAKELRLYIDTIKSKIREHHRKLIETNELVTASTLKSAIMDLETKKHTIVELFKFHNGKMKDLIGKQYAEGTLTRYKTTLKHIEDYIKLNYSNSDVYLSQINYEFISGFEHYLRTIRKCEHNSTMKYIRNFKKIVRLGLINGWIEKDPFINYKIQLKKVERGFLTQEELDKLENKVISIQRLNEIKDVFVFACYTGLPYIDIKKLSYKDIVIGIDGGQWIFSNRTKTKIEFKIPLLTKAAALIDKYKSHPECQSSGLCFPVKSNQKTNAYLKEIATICEIDKNLSFHLGRHSFATTIALTNGVPIEDVSSMLGHTNITTTQVYAKVVEKKISENMKALDIKLNTVIENPKKSD